MTKRNPKPQRELDLTVKVPVPTYGLLRRVAELEDRTLRGIVARALNEYAAKHAPQALQEGSAV